MRDGSNDTRHIPQSVVHAPLLRLRATVGEHRSRLLLVAITVMLSAIDWITGPAVGTFSLVVAILHLLAVSSTALLPRAGSLAVFIVEVLCCFDLPSGGPSRLWGACLAAGLLSYSEGAGSMTMLCVIPYAAVQLVQMNNAYYHDVSGPDIGATVFGLSMILIAAVAGYRLRQRADHEIEQAAAQTAQLQERELHHHAAILEYAAHMHDSVAGRLSNITLTAQRHVKQADAKDRQQWQLIAQESRKALDELHELIREMTIDDRAETPSVQLESQLRSFCEQHDRTLAEQGLQGRTDVHDYGVTVIPQPHAVRALTDMLGELYANIAAYAPCRSTYQCTVTLCDDQAEIVQTNALPDSPMPTLSGKGLNLHAQRLEQLGGTLSAYPCDNEWQCYARIPLA